MKLITKLNRSYLIFVSGVMILSGVILYFTLSVIIRRQTDEQLLNRLHQIENHIKNNPGSLDFKPFAQVEISPDKKESTEFADVEVFNTEEEEAEDFRQLLATRKIGHTYYNIKIAVSKIESDELFQTLMLVLLAGIGLLALTIYLANNKIAQVVWAPFYKNLQVIKSFQLGESKKLKLNKTDISEFKELNAAVENMAERILTDYQNQKQFSEDIAHELQTPLAIVISKIENLMNNKQLNEQQLEPVKSIYKNSKRLSALNHKLVLLNKIGNNQFAGAQDVDFNTKIIDKLNEFRELIEMRKIKLTTSLTSELNVKINPELADILLNNLLSNSIKHNFEGGEITIETRPGQLIVCNTGEQAINDSEKLFKRFYKNNPASNSLGLGLAIVKKICDLGNFKIQYQYQKNKHCFIVEF